MNNYRDNYRDQIKQQLNNGTCIGKIEPQLLVDGAKEIGAGLSVDGPRNHQLRKFYDAVKQIERRTVGKNSDDLLDPNIVAQLLFLRPHLANALSKNRNIKRLCDALDPCLDSEVIKTTEDLTRFVKFFEAIIAYTR